MMTREEYDRAMERIDMLLADVGDVLLLSDEQRNAEMLALIESCEEWEKANVPLQTPTAEEMARFRHDQEATDAFDGFGYL